jgi:hypothetical protein
MNCAARFLLIVTLAAAVGCATPVPADLMVPKSADANYGYTEKQISARSYEIAYVGPEIYTEQTRKAWLTEIAETAKRTSHDLALWRAAELAAANGFKGFTVTAAKGAVQRYIVGRDYENVPVHQFEGAPVRKLEYWSGTYLRGQARLTVELTDEAAEGAYDAAQTAAEMRNRYMEAINRSIMADTRYYFGPSSWLYGYEEGYEEAPAFESSTERPRPPDAKPLGEPYYAP